MAQTQTAPRGAALRYVQHLGDGPAGEVWLAEDGSARRALRRVVKLPAWADPQVVEREVARMAALEHPTIAGVERIVTSDDGRLVLVGPHTPGADLASVQASLRELGVPLSPRAACELAARVALALEIAWNLPHNGSPLRIAHLDLRPASIRLSPTGEVTVHDFGLAALVPGPAGRMRYLAPERLLGVYEGPESDVYALGTITLELMLGATLATAPLTREEHQRWVEEALARLPPAVETFAGLLRRMLAFDAFERPPAGAVYAAASARAPRLPGAALRRVARRFAIAGQSTAPGITRASGPPRPVPRRSLGWTVVAVALISVLLAGLAIGLLLGMEPLLARASVIAPT